MRKKTIRMNILIVILVVLAAFLAGAIKGKNMQEKPKESTAELWAKVGAADKAGLPQTAIESLKKIYALTGADGRDGEAMRALTRLIVLESVIEGNRPGPLVVRLKEEIDKAPARLQPMLRIVLAQWYWHYYSQNKWRFMNRSATEGADDKDFTTWDLRRIFGEIDALFQSILKDEKALKGRPLSPYLGFLVPGNTDLSLRPTLYDFAVFEALDFYMSGEQAAARPEDAFVIEAGSPVLAPAAEFLNWRPETTDTGSPQLRAVLLFQNLLEFHGRDKNADVSFDIDLHRLGFAKNAAAGEGAVDRAIERWKELAEAHGASPLSTTAIFEWANAVFDKGDFLRALELARRGTQTHPQSAGAKNCLALIARIQAKEFTVKVESVLAPEKPSRLAVNYRNLDALHFRVIKEDFASLLNSKEVESLFWMNDERVQRLIAKKPEAEWKRSLPPAPDYKSKSVILDLPALKPGFYRMLVSHSPSFGRGNNKIESASFWVSGLGVVTGGAGSGLTGLVVDALTGDPQAGAEVVLYEWEYNATALRRVDAGPTDALGAFALKSPDSYRNRILHVRSDGGEIAETQIQRAYERADTASTQTVFFTDRSIYRPGQAIHFKGLCLSVDRERNDYRILTKMPVRVVFRDANHEEITALNLVSNDFGSVSGSFTAPADRLTGAMTINAENPRGSAVVRVEEYKRPKFEVKLDVPDREFRLNDQVEVPGEAMTYAGAPVDGALVKFRVVREVRYPWWWYSWGGGSRSESQEIAHGVLRTDETGKFVIAFKARPDPQVLAVSQPTFTYTVSVDITDGTGETRSDSGFVRLGFASLEAALNLAEWQEKGRPVVLNVVTMTLNGKRIAAKGTVEIVALRGPDKPVPADMIGEVAIPLAEALSAKPGAGFAWTPDWHQWPEGKLQGKTDFVTTAEEGKPCPLSFDLPPGVYKALLKTADKFGTAVESRAFIMVHDLSVEAFAVRIPFLGAARAGSVEVGETFEMLWGTGYEAGPVLVEILQNGRRLDRYWTPRGRTQGMIRLPVSEKHRGGFTVGLTLVKENRLYREERRVSVPWSNKRLDLKWKTFRSKLRPGQDETWSVEIKGPKAEVKAAEMVASLYDASLDQFAGHGFPGIFGMFRLDMTYSRAGFSNRSQDFRVFYDSLNTYLYFVTPEYIHFPPDIEESLFRYNYPGMVRKAMAMDMAVPSPPPAAAAQFDAKDGGVAGGVVGGVMVGVGAGDKGGAETEKPAAIDLSAVQARKNLNETAFFYPHLLTGKDGAVTIEFKIPEALTRWRFLGFAHTRDLESGAIEAETVTQKELMVQPNPPRFLREGDSLEFTVKVTNMTEKETAGAVELRFFDPQTEKPLDETLANKTPKLAFTIPAKQSRSFSWPVSVPDGQTVVGFKAVAAADAFSDGEEGVFPVLSRRLMVRESIPLWINDKGEKNFSFEKLAGSGSSNTLRHLGLTVQMASNPSWYAVQALPYLMEFPYECSEQVFNRLYANGLARKLANSNPKIRRVFDLWKGTDALQSNLEKNQDLKSVLLQESPWVLEAKTETQAKRNVGLLFDENVMNRELKNAFGKLAAMQLADGSWPWFPGGRGDSYITLYLATGFGRLKHLGVAGVSQELALKALDHLDGWIDGIYQDILRLKTQGENHLSPTIALYLYGRSFYLAERPIGKEAGKAVDYFLKQGAKFWLQLDNRQSQAHLALALKRFGDGTTAQAVMRSMKERSKVDEELGRYWAETELSWWWYRAPIETQAVMIEAFDEVAGDLKAVEECKVWLLKQKQTQDWKTTKATADAIYGLILRGTDLLASDAIVEVRLGGKVVVPEKVEAGTGFYEKRYGPGEIEPAMGRVTIKKTDPGIAWGGLHWQYLEDIAKITPHAQNPLKLKKTVFVQKSTKAGPVIEPVKGPLAVGDTLIVRIELRTDRDMEYVHMKDHRGSGLEPVNVLSQYKYQDGLAYYEATKDTATHFFIDYLPKGTYVFEYPLKVVHRGTYQNGMAHIECMYAPEFNSHSESVKLEVR
jgi:hypothetical protein